MDALKRLTERVINFRTARDWAQFHKPKDLALSMMVEAAEFGEHFLWKSDAEVASYIQKYKEDLADELSDVLHNVILLAHELEIDIESAFEKKIRKNEAKYPVEKAKGKHSKYREL